MSYDRERRPSEEFDNPLAGRDDDKARPRFKKRPPRALHPWEQQADKMIPPDKFFECCGTRYGACTPESLDNMRVAHNAAKHTGGDDK